jgi:hypothetical protein
LRNATGFQRALFDQAVHDQRVASARETVGKPAFTAAWAEGRAMTLEQATSTRSQTKPTDSLQLVHFGLVLDFLIRSITRT